MCLTMIMLPDFETTKIKPSFDIFDKYYINFENKKIIFAHLLEQKNMVEIHSIKHDIEKKLSIGMIFLLNKLF